MAVTFAEARCSPQFGGTAGRIAAAGWVSLRMNNTFHPSRLSP